MLLTLDLPWIEVLNDTHQNGARKSALGDFRLKKRSTLAPTKAIARSIMT